MEKLTKFITLDHLDSVRSLIKNINLKVDLVDFTVRLYTINLKKLTTQLGNPEFLAKSLSINVISNFRHNDIINGNSSTFRLFI